MSPLTYGVHLGTLMATAAAVYDWRYAVAVWIAGAACYALSLRWKDSNAPSSL